MSTKELWVFQIKYFNVIKMYLCVVHVFKGNKVKIFYKLVNFNVGSVIGTARIQIIFNLTPCPGQLFWSDTSNYPFSEMVQIWIFSPLTKIPQMETASCQGFLGLYWHQVLILSTFSSDIRGLPGSINTLSHCRMVLFVGAPLPLLHRKFLCSIKTEPFLYATQPFVALLLLHCANWVNVCSATLKVNTAKLSNVEENDSKQYG